MSGELVAVADASLALTQSAVARAHDRRSELLIPVVTAPPEPCAVAAASGPVPCKRLRPRAPDSPLQRTGRAVRRIDDGGLADRILPSWSRAKASPFSMVEAGGRSAAGKVIGGRNGQRHKLQRIREPAHRSE
jgi:hypothetical protein